MFAVASILMILGIWVLIGCLLDWDSCVGVIDMRAAGEAMGSDDLARWIIDGAELLITLIGVVCAL